MYTNNKQLYFAVLQIYQGLLYFLWSNIVCGSRVIEQFPLLASHKFREVKSSYISSKMPIY